MAYIVLDPNTYYDPRKPIVAEPGDVLDCRQMSPENGYFGTVNVDLESGMVTLENAVFAIKGFHTVETSPNGGWYVGTDEADDFRSNADGRLYADYIEAKGGDDKLSAVSPLSMLFGGAGKDTFTTAIKTVTIPARYPMNVAKRRPYTAKEAKAAGVAIIPARTITTDAVKDAEPGEAVTKGPIS